MKHQKEARRKQGNMKTQKVTLYHMKECLTQREVQTPVSQYKKNKKSLGPDGVTNGMLSHMGNSAI